MSTETYACVNVMHTYIGGILTYTGDIHRVSCIALRRATVCSGRKANSRLKEVQAELAEFRAENDVSPESPILDDPTSEWSVQEAYFKAREQLLRQVDHSRITSCTYTGWTKSSDTITASFRVGYTSTLMHTEAQLCTHTHSHAHTHTP